tara:strand:+ start:199 stop:339 length:141 start_codon:yes stop_codon:yes gene_type:complete
VHYYQTDFIKFDKINPLESIEADGEVLGKSIREVKIIKNGIKLLNY